MKRRFDWRGIASAAAGLAVLAMAAPAAAQDSRGEGPAWPARQMDACMTAPSAETAGALAAALQAEVQPLQTREDPVTVSPASASQSIRTRADVTEGRQWRGDGILVQYRAETLTSDIVDSATGRVVERIPTRRIRTCTVAMPVSAASTALADVPLSLDSPAYLTLAGDRRVLVFQRPSRQDARMQVLFRFREPLDLPLPAQRSGMYPVRVTDGGPDILEPTGELPEIVITRAALSAAAAHPAVMVIMNEVPVAGE